MFGELVKARRIELGLTLREFCRRLGEDPSNWSKVERGIMKPPQRTEKLQRIAGVLKIREGSGDWKALVDTATIGAGEIPEYVRENREVYHALPAFFRTMGSVRLTADEIRQMIDRLVKADSAGLQPETDAQQLERRAIIVAGPNGAGKTTFAREYLEGYEIPYISADAIAERMTDGDIREVALAAGKRFFFDLYGAIDSGKSFVVETTLSGLGFRSVLERLKRERYAVDIVFIYLDSPEFCVARIVERTRKGGHHVSEKDVIRRYQRSIANFREMYMVEADGWYLFCNSGQQFVEVARGSEDELLVFEEQQYNAVFQEKGWQAGGSVFDSRSVRIADEIRRIGSRAVHKAQEGSRRLGIPNTYLINECTYYELTDGTLSQEDPYVER